MKWIIAILLVGAFMASALVMYDNYTMYDIYQAIYVNTIPKTRVFFDLLVIPTEHTFDFGVLVGAMLAIVLITLMQVLLDLINKYFYLD